jgi:hypothetical protein
MMHNYAMRPLLRFLSLILGFGVVAAPAHAEPPPAPDPAQEEKKNDELSRKLLRKAQTGADEDVMDSIMRLMDEAASNMEVKLDPGLRTQEVQKEILAKLDEAIQAAAARRRPMRPPDSKPHQDRRRRGEDKAQRQKQDVAGKPSRGAGEEEGEAKGAVIRPVELPDGQLIDVRRAWGHLPMREREEIIQGVGEDFLEKYREWVERYYRALQESASEPK